MRKPFQFPVRSYLLRFILIVFAVSGCFVGISCLLGILDLYLLGIFSFVSFFVLFPFVWLAFMGWIIRLNCQSKTDSHTA